MGFLEKWTRQQYAACPQAFSTKFWGWLPEKYISGCLPEDFEKIITTMAMMAFVLIGPLPLIAVNKAVKFIRHQDRFYWLLGKKPYLANLVYAKWCDKKIKEAINLFK